MPEELLDSSNAIGYLRAQHETIEALLASLANVQHAEFARQVIRPLMIELRLHSQLERDYFYPYAHRKFENKYLERAVEDSQTIDSLSGKLEGIDPDQPQFDETLDRLIKTFRHHALWEEEDLFLRLEGSSPDTLNELIVLANRMKRQRAQILDQTRRGVTPSVTKGDLQQRLAQERGRGLAPERDVVLDAEQKARTRGSTDIKVGPSGETVSQGRRNLELSDSASAQETVDRTPGTVELTEGEYRTTSAMPVDAESSGAQKSMSPGEDT